MAGLTDGKLVHLDSLNLSHAWMLEGIATRLPDDNYHQPALIVSAAAPGVRARASGLMPIRCTVTKFEK